MRKNMPLELPLVVLKPECPCSLCCQDINSQGIYNVGYVQGSSCECMQPMRDDVALQRRFSLVGRQWTHQGSFCECTQPMRRYIVTSSLNGWMHAQNDPCNWSLSPCMRKNFYPPPLSKIDVKKLYEMQICFYSFFSQKNSAPGVMYLESGTN